MAYERINVPEWALLKIAERDKWVCHVCNQGYLPYAQWVVDHDKALAKGGGNYVNNLRLAHSRCNNEKSDA